MAKKKLLYVLAALLFTLAGQPVQAKHEPGEFLKKNTGDDLTPVEQGKKWGYIDKTGRVVIPFKFDYAQKFSEGLAAAHRKGKCGYIDKTGKFVIEPRFIGGYPFSEGLAIAIMSESEKERIITGKFGYIDRGGKMVIKGQEQVYSRSPHFDPFEGMSFSEGLACSQQNNKTGYIDKTGKMVIPAEYVNAGPFSEGLAAVMVEDKYGYIDGSGKMVIPPQFKEAGPFSGGLALIKSDENQKGYIDKSGKLVIDGRDFGLARGFSEGLAAVMGKNDKYGYIDKTGTFVIQPQFDRGGDFSEGLAAVEPVSRPGPGNLAYIDQKGQMVIKSMSTLPDRVDWQEFDLHYYRFCGGVARVDLGKKGDSDAEGYINKQGKFIWPAVPSAKK